MRSVKDLRKRAATRTRSKTRVYSTSEARANFAEALETAQVENAVIGFDRYGRTVAALVPIEAIYMLAGQANKVPAATRQAIEAGAAQFISSVPNRLSPGEAPASAPEPRKAARAPAKKKAKRKSSRLRS